MHPRYFSDELIELFSRAFPSFQKACQANPSGCDNSDRFRWACYSMPSGGTTYEARIERHPVPGVVQLPIQERFTPEWRWFWTPVDPELKEELKEVLLAKMRHEILNRTFRHPAVLEPFSYVKYLNGVYDRRHYKEPALVVGSFIETYGWRFPKTIAIE